MAHLLRSGIQIGHRRYYVLRRLQDNHHQDGSRESNLKFADEQ